jgi:2,3-bisphosphoglycerate-dependent phosphoglycerate mutase
MKNNCCIIYLIRHGRTDWNDKRLIQGHLNIPLNSEGQITAKGIAKKLKKIKFDKIYSSDLSRASQTAEIIALEHKLTVETTNALRERCFGGLEGKSHEEFKKRDSILDALEDKARYLYKFDSDVAIESDKEMMNRFIAFLREIAVENSGKTVLVSTHAGIMGIFLIKLGLFAYKEHIHVDNLGFAKLESDGVDFFVKETKGIEQRNS